MKDVLLGMYHKSPHFVREMLINIYATKRYSWRYGKNAEELIEASKDRESWNRPQWQKYQEELLAPLLHRAVAKVPYYRNLWEERKRKGDNRSPSYLENWPILTKEQVRTNNRALVADDCNIRNMSKEHTSGTSGKPINVFMLKETTRSYYAIYERRIRNWHGVDRKSKYIMLGGQLVIPFAQTKPPFWVHNMPMNQLYMSAYHISEKNIRSYCDAINKFMPEYMFGYASSMYSLALLIKLQNLQAPVLKVSISNAEPLFEYQKKTIEEVFGCKVVNTYGMTEIAAAACTYDSEDLILWPDAGIIDTYDFESDIKLPIGTEGRFICTGLINKDMPLINYEVGDGGIIDEYDGKINYQAIKSVTGRIDDMVITSDGRKIGRLDPVFKSNLNISEAQIIQEDYNYFIIKIVPSSHYNKEDGISISENLKKRVGNVRVEILLVDSIERTNSGKFKAVISKVN